MYCFEKALNKSCNVAFALIAQELGAEKLTLTAERLGFNSDTKMTVNGKINLATSRLDLSSSTDLDIGWAGIGQYTTLINPCQMLTTISAIAKILEENRICSASDFIKSCSSETILQKYNIPGTTCEGYLFPDTYYLNVNMESDFIVEHFIENFIENLKSIPNYAEKTPEELFEIVTLASIVEKEYKVKEEAPLIASVFKNRIRHNIGLYSCATIVYIITEIQGKPHPNRILTKDTKIDNPYNTYKWAGLTPGPISNPGLTALDAVINTPKTPYFFFQVKDEKKGTHVFTETFEEHKTNH